MPTRGSLAFLLLGLSCIISARAQVEAETSDLTSLVNLFIGTETGANGGSGGNGFPGTYAEVWFFMINLNGSAFRRSNSSCHGEGTRLISFRGPFRDHHVFCRSV